MKGKIFTKLFSVLLLAVCFTFSPQAVNAQTYCTPPFLNGCNGFNPWHNNTITLNTLSWAIGSTSCTISDYTSMSTTLTAGVPYLMTVASGVYTGCTVWIDLNDNGSFEDPGENMFYSYVPGPGGYETYTFNVTIPACQPNGTHRMRVLAGWGSDGYTVGGTNGYGSCGAVIGYQYGNYDDFTVNVVQATCDTPTTLAASAITFNSATLSWSTACSATCQYILNTSSVTPTTAGTATTASSYNATGLTSGVTYYFHIRNMCSDGDSSAWIEIPFTTLSNCGVPVTPTVSSITTTSAVFTWGVPGSSTVTDYEYTLNTTGIAPSSPGTPTTATSYTATGLTPGTTYYFYVRTICATGDSSAWELVTFSTPLPCEVPVSVTASGITTSSATLNWTIPAGATVANYQYTLDEISSAPIVSGTVTATTTYSASGLTAGTVYYFHVRTMCADGDSSAWVTIPFTTLFPCDLPVSVSVGAIIPTGATFYWSSPTAGAAVSDYQYTLNTSPGSPTSPGTPTTATSYVATGLAPVTTYYFHVRTMCTDGDSSAWVTVTFMTIPLCDTPTIVMNDITYKGAHLRWNRVYDATEYQYVLNNSPAVPTVPGTSTTDTEYNMIGLLPLTTYYFHLSTVCSSSASPWVTTNFTTTYVNVGVVNVNGNDDFGIDVNPNPAKEIVTVTINGEQSGSAFIQLTDMAGRMIQTLPVNGKNVTLDLGNLPQGMYFVRYMDERNKQTVKLVK